MLLQHKAEGVHCSYVIAPSLCETVCAWLMLPGGPCVTGQVPRHVPTLKVLPPKALDSRCRGQGGRGTPGASACSAWPLQALLRLF